MRPTVVVTFAALAAVAALGSGRPVSACDSTACAAATRSADGAFRHGQWRVDLSARYIDQSRRLNGSRTTAQVTRPRVDLATERYDTGFHNELNASMSAVQIELGYGLTASTSLYAAVPVFHHAAVEHLHFAALPGAPVDPEHNVHGGDGTNPGEAFSLKDSARGLGDIRVGVQQTLADSEHYDLAAGLVLKLPTGSTNVPAADGVVDPMLQPGTGASDVAATLQYVRRLPSASVAVVASFQKTTTSSHHYRFGDEVLVAASASKPLGARFNGTLQVKVQRVGRHRFFDADVPATGGTLAQIAPVLRFRASPTVALYGSLQVPAYIHVNESQLGPRMTMTAGIVKAF
jgi:hypothetical protein